jgi:hypothetical protein
VGYFPCNGRHVLHVADIQSYRITAMNCVILLQNLYSRKMYELTGGEMDNELMCPRIKIFKTLKNRHLMSLRIISKFG